MHISPLRVGKDVGAFPTQQCNEEAIPDRGALGREQGSKLTEPTHTGRAKSQQA